MGRTTLSPRYVAFINTLSEKIFVYTSPCDCLMHGLCRSRSLGQKIARLCNADTLCRQPLLLDGDEFRQEHLRQYCEPDLNQVPVNMYNCTTIPRMFLHMLYPWVILQSLAHATTNGARSRERLLSLLILGLLPFDTHASTGIVPGFSLRTTTNYVVRGYTRSNEQPSAQVNLDFDHTSGLFVGSWISTVSFTGEHSESEKDNVTKVLPMSDATQATPDNPAQIEFQPYIGFNWSLNSKWRAEAIAAGYIYDGTVMGGNYDYAEIYGRLHYKDLLSMRLGIAPNSYGYELTNVNVDVQARYPLTDTFEVSAGLGYDDASIVSEYSIIHWNAGAQWNVGKHITFELRYYGRHAMANTDSMPMLHAAPVLGFPIVFAVSVGF